MVARPLRVSARPTLRPNSSTQNKTDVCELENPNVSSRFRVEFFFFFPRPDWMKQKSHTDDGTARRGDRFRIVRHGPFGRRHLGHRHPRTRGPSNLSGNFEVPADPKTVVRRPCARPATCAYEQSPLLFRIRVRGGAVRRVRGVSRKTTVAETTRHRGVCICRREIGGGSGDGGRG